jgi:hypothetical protein
MMSDLNSIPSCLGYGRPTEGNSCESCEARDLCVKFCREFVPKSTLLGIYERVLRIEKALMEARA